MVFVRARTKFNKTKKKAKFKYKSIAGHKFGKLANSNLRKFWKIFQQEMSLKKTNGVRLKKKE